MKRKEFTSKVQAQIIKRATRDGLVLCEECGTMAKRWEIDHTIADALVIEKKSLTVDDGRLLCVPCHKIKTESDKGHIAKAKRREQKKLGTKAVTIQSAGFSPVDRSTKASRLRPASKHEGMGPPNLARRFM
jgi:5-methylcytosine-specific restriction endonuclease McrA